MKNKHEEFKKVLNLENCTPEQAQQLVDSYKRIWKKYIKFMKKRKKLKRPNYA